MLLLSSYLLSLFLPLAWGQQTMAHGPNRIYCLTHFSAECPAPQGGVVTETAWLSVPKVFPLCLLEKSSVASVADSKLHEGEAEPVLPISVLLVSSPGFGP